MGRLSALGLAVFALLLWLAMFAGDRRERKRASPDPSAEGKPSAGKDADGATSAAPPDTKAAQPDPRGLHELALEIAAAQRGSDPETLDERLGAIHKSWQGRRYRWEVGHVAALCASAARCAVLPFDQKRFERPVVQGWLPTLELTPEALARIGTLCEGRAPCVLTVEATLSKLHLSSVLPTQLGLADVSVVSARGAADTEAWGRR